MTPPFEESITTEPGLTEKRLVWGMPPLVVALLIPIIVAPVLALGKAFWWLTPLGLLAWGILAIVVADDPDILSVMQGEMKLKDYYE